MWFNFGLYYYMWFNFGFLNTKTNINLKTFDSFLFLGTFVVLSLYNECLFVIKLIVV